MPLAAAPLRAALLLELGSALLRPPPFFRGAPWLGWRSRSAVSAIACRIRLSTQVDVESCWLVPIPSLPVRQRKLPPPFFRS